MHQTPRIMLKELKPCRAGGKLSDIEIPLIKAILASGIYGKSAAKKAEKAIAEAEAEQAPDEDLYDEGKKRRRDGEVKPSSLCEGWIGRSLLPTDLWP